MPADLSRPLDLLNGLTGLSTRLQGSIDKLAHKPEGRSIAVCNVAQQVERVHSARAFAFAPPQRAEHLATACLGDVAEQSFGCPEPIARLID